MFKTLKKRLTLPDYLNRDNILALTKQLSKQCRKRYNIILISIDALRPDHLGCYGYDRDTSPNIDALSAKGTIFKNAFSASSWTVPSNMSLFTGLYPSRHGMIFYPFPESLSKDIKMYTEVLKENGYFNIGFHGGGYMSPLFGFDMGFHKYVSFGTRFEDNQDSCLNWIERFSKYKIRFSLFLHGFNCHHPYKVPKRFDKFSVPEVSNDYVTKLMVNGGVRKSESDLEAIIDKYDGEIRYADYLIGGLISKLEKLRLLENSVIIITSDHGEQFQEHGITGHVYGLYDELIRIPLIMYIPRVTTGKVVHEMVSIVDIMPTILDILDIKNINYDKPNGKTMSSLINGKKENIRECIIAEAGFLNQNQKKFYRAIRTEKYKLVLNKKYLPDSFYDLTSDPLEQKSIRHDSNRIKQLIDLSEKNGISNDIDFSNKEKQEHTINEELKKQLQMLGYF